MKTSEFSKNPCGYAGDGPLKRCPYAHPHAQTQDSKTARQQDSKTARQQDSKTARQQDSKTARQQDSKGKSKSKSKQASKIAYCTARPLLSCHTFSAKARQPHGLWAAWPLGSSRWDAGKAGQRERLKPWLNKFKNKIWALPVERVPYPKKPCQGL